MPAPDWTRGPAKTAAALAVIAAALTAAVGGGAARLPAMHPPAMALPEGRLDVNRATEAELMLLRGIGPATAGAIVADRAARGPFASIEDLDRVHGIGPRTIRRMAPYIVASAPD